MTDEERDKIADYMLAYSQGDSEAFSKFCQEFYLFFKTFIFARVKDIHTASDLTQEVFLKIQQLDFKKHDFENISNIPAYLFQLAKNLVNNYCARKKRKKEEMLTENIMHFDSYDDLEFSEMVNGFTQQELKILKLKYIEGYELKDIAKVMGVSANTVGRRVRSLKKKAKKNQTIIMSSIILTLILTLFI